LRCAARRKGTSRFWGCDSRVIARSFFFFILNSPKLPPSQGRTSKARASAQAGPRKQGPRRLRPPLRPGNGEPGAVSKGRHRVPSGRHCRVPRRGRAFVHRCARSLSAAAAWVSQDVGVWRAARPWGPSAPYRWPALPSPLPPRLAPACRTMDDRAPLS
jgi:hypothetical protein